MSGECLGSTFGVNVGGMYGKYGLGTCMEIMELEWPPGAWAEDTRLSSMCITVLGQVNLQSLFRVAQATSTWYRDR
jgi:hypothetical protein